MSNVVNINGIIAIFDSGDNSQPSAESDSIAGSSTASFRGNDSVRGYDMDAERKIPPDAERELRITDHKNRVQAVLKTLPDEGD